MAQSVGAKTNVDRLAKRATLIDQLAEVQCAWLFGPTS